MEAAIASDEDAAAEVAKVEEPPTTLLSELHCQYVLSLEKAFQPTPTCPSSLFSADARQL